MQRAAEHYLTSAELKPASVHRKLSVFRRYAKYHGISDPLHDYNAPPLDPPSTTLLPQGIQGVLALARATYKPHHMACIFMCGLLGLRLHEAMKVTPADFDLTDGIRRLRVTGKGRKVRYVPVADNVWGLLSPTLADVAATEPVCGHINERTMRRAITRASRRAGLTMQINEEFRDFASHDLRRTFGSEVYHGSKDLRATQELLGHASMVTTQRYTTVRPERLIEAATFELDTEREE